MINNGDFTQQRPTPYSFSGDNYTYNWPREVAAEVQIKAFYSAMNHVYKRRRD